MKTRRNLNRRKRPKTIRKTKRTKHRKGGTDQEDLRRPGFAPTPEHLRNVFGDPHHTPAVGGPGPGMVEAGHGGIFGVRYVPRHMIERTRLEDEAWARFRANPYSDTPPAGFPDLVAQGILPATVAPAMASRPDQVSRYSGSPYHENLQVTDYATRQTMPAAPDPELAPLLFTMGVGDTVNKPERNQSLKKKSKQSFTRRSRR